MRAASATTGWNVVADVSDMVERILGVAESRRLNEGEQCQHDRHRHQTELQRPA